MEGERGQRVTEKDIRKTVGVSLSNYNKCQMPGQSGHIWLKSSCPISSYCQDSKYCGS